MTLDILKKEKTVIGYVFPKLLNDRHLVRNCLRSPISEEIRIVNILKDPKHCWNLRGSSFLIIFQNS